MEGLIIEPEKINFENSIGQRIAAKLSKVFQKDCISKLQQYCRGEVLDVGGRDYFLLVKDLLKFDRWTCLEYEEDALLQLDDPRYRCIHGDGCNMHFESDTFDTVVNIQVLEHVFEPVTMVKEISRVLKPGGHALFVIPQTVDLHMAPLHFYNFTRYWIVEAMKRANLQIVELNPNGGVWRTIASRSFLFFWHSFKVDGWFVKGVNRPLLFYLLFPFMAVYALFNIPICIFLSLGDLIEEANNHLVVVRKPSSTDSP
jgi:SAM-dependent methyltransferase